MSLSSKLEHAQAAYSLMWRMLTEEQRKEFLLMGKAANLCHPFRDLNFHVYNRCLELEKIIDDPVILSYLKTKKRIVSARQLFKDKLRSFYKPFTYNPKVPLQLSLFSYKPIKISKLNKPFTYKKEKE